LSLKQLPLFAAHTTFHLYQRSEEIQRMVRDHVAIFEQLIAGRIDEVRIYSRALSVAEIQADMNRAVGP